MNKLPETSDSSEKAVANDALFAGPLLAEYVDEGNWGNFALCGHCGQRCGREGCRSCDETGTDERNGEPCENCIGGECFWCDDCGQIEGWLPKGQRAPTPSSANDRGLAAARCGPDQLETLSPSPAPTC